MSTPVPRFRGVMSPVLTPFNQDLTPSPSRFVKHCRWLLKQKVGLAIFGTNSEANSLSVNEKLSLLEALLWLARRQDCARHRDMRAARHYRADAPCG